MSKSKKIIDILLEHPAGISCDEIMIQTGYGRNTVHGCKFSINKYNNRYYIKSKNGKYIISEKKSKEINTTNVVHNNSSQSVLSKRHLSSQIKNKDIEKMRYLSEADRDDVLEMLKKSMFYQGSALCLIEANELIERIRRQIQV